ncbi:hypothetical protein BDV96DRAFT_648292 [Lophiotrema nucula]|uniref:BTB domain-containing protein n=1 Tax=Lophiotrema nucula TaxID=690887 RepID=A0A6A5Z2N2_9PLEO|nr:hypothetical protein BDV96DRAFT_648292 [Lophiotrema nucula]
MSREWPYVQHMAHMSNSATKFVVGDTKRHFEIHNTVLLKHSSRFQQADGTPGVAFPNDFPRIVQLPQVSEADFVFICRWLYDTAKYPPYNTETDLPRLMRLWLAAGELGLWKYQNAMLRLAMALCQPKDFKIDIDMVKFVYDKTPPNSKLAQFIMTAWVQRSPNVEVKFFNEEYEDVSILEDAVKVLKWLRGVRGKLANPVTRDGDGNVKMPLPDYLVWNEQGGALPDGMFVGAAESRMMAANLGR